MKSQNCLFLILLIVCLSCQSKKTDKQTGIDSTLFYTNPVIGGGSEPWAIFHEGKYYYTQSLADCIILWETDDITQLAEAAKKTYIRPKMPLVYLIFGDQRYTIWTINGISIALLMMVI